MRATNIQTRKKQLLNYIREVKDENILSLLEEFMEKSINSVPLQRKPFSKSELVAGVYQAEKDFEEGRFYTSNQLEANLGL